MPISTEAAEAIKAIRERAPQESFGRMDCMHFPNMQPFRGRMEYWQFHLGFWTILKRQKLEDDSVQCALLELLEEHALAAGQFRCAELADCLWERLSDRAKGYFLAGLSLDLRRDESRAWIVEHHHGAHWEVVSFGEFACNVIFHRDQELWPLVKRRLDLLKQATVPKERRYQFDRWFSKCTSISSSLVDLLLECAVRTHNAPIARFFINFGAQPNSAYLVTGNAHSNWFSALSYSIARPEFLFPSKDILTDLLLDSGAQPGGVPIEGLNKPLFSAWSKGDLTLVDKLLERGASFEGGMFHEFGRDERHAMYRISEDKVMERLFWCMNLRFKADKTLAAFEHAVAEIVPVSHWSSVPWYHNADGMGGSYFDFLGLAYLRGEVDLLRKYKCKGLKVKVTLPHVVWLTGKRGEDVLTYVLEELGCPPGVAAQLHSIVDAYFERPESPPPKIEAKPAAEVQSIPEGPKRSRSLYKNLDSAEAIAHISTIRQSEPEVICGRMDYLHFRHSDLFNAEEDWLLDLRKAWYALRRTDFDDEGVSLALLGLLEERPWTAGRVFCEKPCFESDGRSVQLIIPELAWQRLSGLTKGRILAGMSDDLSSQEVRSWFTAHLEGARWDALSLANFGCNVIYYNLRDLFPFVFECEDVNLSTATIPKERRMQYKHWFETCDSVSGRLIDIFFECSVRSFNREAAIRCFEVGANPNCACLVAWSSSHDWFSALSFSIQIPDVSRYSRDRLANLLLDSGTDPQGIPAEGLNKPLHCAWSRRDFALVDRLLDLGAKFEGGVINAETRRQRGESQDQILKDEDALRPLISSIGVSLKRKEDNLAALESEVQKLLPLSSWNSVPWYDCGGYGTTFTDFLVPAYHWQDLELLAKYKARGLAIVLTLPHVLTLIHSNRDTSLAYALSELGCGPQVLPQLYQVVHTFTQKK